jgi:hypothetical protein
VRPRAGLDVCEKSRPHRDSILSRPARSQSLYRLSYKAIYIYMERDRERESLDDTDKPLKKANCNLNCLDLFQFLVYVVFS